jgi:putative DNA primase/helicase
MSKLLPFVPPPPNAEQHARAETERTLRLFEWADFVLQELGFAERVLRAHNSDELRKIIFDATAVEVTLAVREALHPASGQKRNHFTGLNDKQLRRILQLRFHALKKNRDEELRRGGTAGDRRRSNTDWMEKLKLDDKGGVRPLLANLILFLRHHREWEGVLGYDEFAARVVIRKPPPWGNQEPDTLWSDHFDSLTRVWFQDEDINANEGDVGRAVQAAARYNTFHPVREYLATLIWDGTPRLDTWLVDYFHAEDSAYVRAVGPRWLISAVARIYRPGCQVDHTLVLEGPQGKQKSKALRTLAVKDEWFTDRLSHVSSKDAAQEITGKWLVELAEMDAYVRAASSSAKAYLTRRFDHFRPPYGKHTINLARQCVFSGSLNPAGGYLKDPTGSRRIWPVECHGMIDVDGIERDRDQLWAEAVHRFNAGAPWWLETPQLEALATVEQRARFWVDPWTEQVENWIGDKTETSVAEVLEGALGLTGAAQTRSAQMRTAAIVTHLGFTRYRPRRGDARPHRYSRPQS